jgi:hypothetical protein
MDFVFIIDTSTSMLQGGMNNVSFLDLAKVGANVFVKMRKMTAEGKWDRYALMTTSKTAEFRLRSDFWHANQSPHFEAQLRGI